MELVRVKLSFGGCYLGQENAAGTEACPRGDENGFGKPSSPAAAQQGEHAEASEKGGGGFGDGGQGEGIREGCVRTG